MPIRREEWLNCRRFEVDVRRDLRRLPYRAQFESFLREYVVTLDTVDAESTFFRLWTLLERLTNCGEDGSMNYDKLVRRASVAWKDRRVAIMLLEHLRHVRNRMVHHLELHGDMNTCRWQLIRCVHGMFLLHLNFGHNFKNLSEFGDFLQVTREVDALRREIDVRQIALQHVAPNEASAGDVCSAVASN